MSFGIPLWHLLGASKPMISLQLSAKMSFRSLHGLASSIFGCFRDIFFETQKCSQSRPWPLWEQPQAPPQSLRNLPRIPQAPCEAPQGTPSRPPMPPKRPECQPQTSLKRPLRLPKGSRGAPSDPQGCPKHPQGIPKHPKRSPRLTKQPSCPATQPPNDAASQQPQ